MIDDGAKYKRVAILLYAVLIGILSIAGSYLKVNSQNADSSLVEIKMTSKQFAFEPDSATVRKGQRVKLILNTADVEHSFTIKEFKVNVSVKPHQIKTVYFTPNQTGTFRYVCDVYCGSGHKKMHGEFIVTE
ncbi:MAG: cytochrome c oxidase subunit II [Pyrinomonadaceae bacterium]